MTEQQREKTSPESTPRGQDVTAGKGRRDEVGHTGIYPASGPFPEGTPDILTPADINKPHGRGGSGVQQSEAIKGSERLPRRGDEMDKLDSDQLTD